MTPEEAIAQIVATTPLEENDVRGIMACSPEGIAALVEGYRVAGVVNERATWDKILDVLRQVSEVASIVAPIEGAVAGLIPIAAVL